MNSSVLILEATLQNWILTSSQGVKSSDMAGSLFRFIEVTEVQVVSENKEIEGELILMFNSWHKGD